MDWERSRKFNSTYKWLIYRNGDWRWKGGSKTQEKEKDIEMDGKNWGDITR